MRFMIPGSRRYFGQPLDRRDVLGFVGTLLASAAFNSPVARRPILPAALKRSRAKRLSMRATSIGLWKKHPRFLSAIASRPGHPPGSPCCWARTRRSSSAKKRNSSLTSFCRPPEAKSRCSPVRCCLIGRADSRPVAVKIRSSYGLIAVRGTKFFAGPSNGVFGVFVDHGTVTVSGGGSEVVLQAGRGQTWPLRAQNLPRPTQVGHGADSRRLGQR